MGEIAGGEEKTLGATAACPPRRADASGAPTATLEQVDIAQELFSRPLRAPDYETEDRAFAVLAREMAENPRNMLQKLVETAVELCGADTAGISLLEGDVFRWEAVAGVFAASRNGTMPRSASPCGVCIERDSTQLMHLADRCFPALRAEPPFVEALLIPFRVHGRPVGTVWIVAHQYDRKFDRADERIMRILSDFASAGWQLWSARNIADETSRRKDAFLAVLGHELRNPLAAIVGASDILTRTQPPDGPGQRAAGVLARQCNHLTRMAEDLLDLSRIGEGKLELKKRRIDLRTVVADAVETSRAPIERNSHHLWLDLPAEPIWLEADAERLGQLLTNLLVNAAKYTPEGGEIRLRAARQDGEAVISVRDSGIGIAADHLEDVFKMFEQVESSVGRSGGGLGVGLALVRSLAELHGGSVAAKSAGVGKGSEFIVRLPVAGPEQSSLND